MEKNTPTYTYNCVDDSLLLPYFKKYYVSIYFRFIPAGFTANYITLISTGFIIFLVYLVRELHFLPTAAIAGIFALCLHNYVVGDHLDGMQAKETKTSSPLGEFLDHYLDVYNGAVVFFTLSVFLKPISDEVFYLLLVVNCLAFAATMMEELERNQLYFGPIGTLEGLVLLIAFFLSWMVPPIRKLWQTELLWGYPAYWLVIIIFGAGLLFTIVDIIRRLGYIPGAFSIFVVFLIVVSFCCYYGKQDRLVGWLIVLLYCGDYVGRIMNSYFLSQKHKYPDLLAPIIAGALIVMIFTKLSNSFIFQWLNWFLFAYLTFRVVWIFSLTIFQLRIHWFWWNPKHQPDR